MSIHLRFPVFVVLCLGLLVGIFAQETSPSEIEQQAIAAAEAKYPLYQPGQNVVITFAREKGSRVTYHGVYRPISPTMIQIGKNYVTLTDLPDEIRARFDAELNARMREEEIRSLLWNSNVVRSSSENAVPSPQESPSSSGEATVPLGSSQYSSGGGDRDAASDARLAAEDAQKRANEVRARDLSPDFYREAESNLEWGRLAFRDRNFEKATECYREAECLYRQAVEEGRQKLERDAAIALAQERWQTVRDIANWMDKFDSARGAEMLRQTDQAESDAYYSRGEAALARGDWAAARQFADKLYNLDEGRFTDLKRRANRGEADELTGWIRQITPQHDWTRARQYCGRLKAIFPDEGQDMIAEVDRAEADDAAARVRRAIQQNDWTGARQSCRRLKELFPGESAEMLREVDRAEVAYCIGQAKNAIKDHEWSKARTHISRITVIDPNNEKAPKLLAQTNKGEVAELTEWARNAIARHDWAKARMCVSRIEAIQPTNADAPKLLAQANKGEEDELFADAKKAQNDEDWPTLYDRAHRLAEFNPKRAKPFLDKLKKVGEIKISVTVTVEKWYFAPGDEWNYSCEYILYEGNTRIASKNSQQMSVVFEDVEVSLGSTLRAEMLPKNGYGAIAETLETEEKVIAKTRNQKITLKCR